MPKFYRGQWFPPGTWACLLVITLMCTACVQNLPELHPMKYASPDPGEEWKPPPDQESARLPASGCPLSRLTLNHTPVN